MMEIYETEIYERKVCVIMYIKKSVISGIIIMTGICVLAALTILYCFTEVQIPRAVYMAIWVGCIAAVTEIVGKIEK